MKNENNILDQIGNKNPFSVPENYFENFNKNMIEKISKEENISVSFYRKITPYIYMAAMFAVIIFAGNLLLNKASTNENMASQEKVKEQVNEELLTYIDENTLIEYLLDNDEETN